MIQVQNARMASASALLAAVQPAQAGSFEPRHSICASQGAVLQPHITPVQIARCMHCRPLHTLSSSPVHAKLSICQLESTGSSGDRPAAFALAVACRSEGLACRRPVLASDSQRTMRLILRYDGLFEAVPAHAEPVDVLGQVRSRFINSLARSAGLQALQGVGYIVVRCQRSDAVDGAYKRLILRRVCC